MAVFKEVLEGKFVKLRDVTFEDIPEIIKLRTDPRLSRYIHPINPDPEVQRKWLETQKKKEGDYYLAIVRKPTGEFIGTISLYNHIPEEKIVELGRWVSKGFPQENVESLLLAYDYAFYKLNVETVELLVVVENKKIINLHKSLGAKEIKLIKKGTYSDLFDNVLLHMSKEKYGERARKHLRNLIKML